jgi:hypothetical protein
MGLPLLLTPVSQPLLSQNSLLLILLATPP